MRKTVAVLVVLALLLFLADVGVRRYQENKVARAIKTSLGMAREPAVSLHGFPFLAELVQGRISSATLDAAALRQGSITFSRIHLFLRRLKFSVPDLLQGNLAAIHAAGGSGKASVNTAAANAFLRAHGVPFQVAFQGGHTVAKLGPFSASLDVNTTIVDGRLRISAGSSLLPTVTVSLPPIFRAVTYGSVQPAEGRLVIHFQMHHPTLDLQP